MHRAEEGGPDLGGGPGTKGEADVKDVLGGCDPCQVARDCILACLVPSKYNQNLVPGRVPRPNVSKGSVWGGKIWGSVLEVGRHCTVGTNARNSLTGRRPKNKTAET